MIQDPNPSHENDTTASRPESDAEYFACCAARLLADSNCEDVVVLDLRGMSQITDYYVIASGTSDRQIKSVADDLRHLAADMKQSPISKPSTQTTQWIVVDFVDVIIHLFDAPTRAFYDLESLWGDGREIRWQPYTKPGQFARISSGQ